MAWTINFDARALKELKKIDKHAQKTILRYCKERLANSADPRQFGKPLKGDKYGLWRYRVQNYRIICKINEAQLTVLVLRIAHRRHIYQ